MTRILHTEWSDGWGGQEHRIISEMRGMQSRGHNVWLAARNKSKISEVAKKNGLNVVFIGFRGKLDILSILKLGYFIKKNKIEVVNTHSGIDSWVAGLAAFLSKVPLVRTRHLNLPIKPSLLNFIHYLPSKYVTCGKVMAENLIVNSGIPAGRVVSIPTGIDVDRFERVFSRESIRKSLGIRREEIVVLMVGVIRAVKRYEIAIKAFLRFREQFANSRLLIAGAGPMMGDMQLLVDTLGLKNSVVFLGHREDIPELMAASDMFLLTSRSEGIPQVLNQAHAAGLPIVATNVGGVGEVIVDKKTGLLAKVDDITEISAKLIEYQSSMELRCYVIKNGRFQVKEKYSVKSMLDATDQLYKELME